MHESQEQEIISELRKKYSKRKKLAKIMNVAHRAEQKAPISHTDKLIAAYNSIKLGQDNHPMRSSHRAKSRTNQNQQHMDNARSTLRSSILHASQEVSFHEQDQFLQEGEEDPSIEPLNIEVVAGHGIDWAVNATKLSKAIMDRH